MASPNQDAIPPLSGSFDEFLAAGNISEAGESIYQPLEVAGKPAFVGRSYHLEEVEPGVFDQSARGSMTWIDGHGYANAVAHQKIAEMEAAATAPADPQRVYWRKRPEAIESSEPAGAVSSAKLTEPVDLTKKVAPKNADVSDDSTAHARVPAGMSRVADAPRAFLANKLTKGRTRAVSEDASSNSEDLASLSPATKAGAVALRASKMKTVRIAGALTTYQFEFSHMTGGANLAYGTIKVARFAGHIMSFGVF